MKNKSRMSALATSISIGLEVLTSAIKPAKEIKIIHI
jgi:hypothetical protein